MSDELTDSERYQWERELELKLRRSSGDSFQAFFSDVMEAVHGSDYVRVRAFGSLGDKGCDGYHAPSGRLYQCYGPMNAQIKDKQQVKTLVTKIENDFATARTKLNSIIKEWHFVSNFVDGLPVEAVEAIQKLKKENPGIVIGQIGLPGMKEVLFKLDKHRIANFLGPAATDKDLQNLDLLAVRNLVAALAIKADAVEYSPPDLRVVPPNKLAANNLPPTWRRLISGGWPNAYIIEEYFQGNPDPTLGDRIATFLKWKYIDLRQQGLEPGAIMSQLYDLVAGIHHTSPATQVAAQSLLAFLFENCDIFEPTTETTP